jgi:hypothetical protein
MANSLTSLVDSQKMKIVKPKKNCARDVDYVPDNGDDSEEDHQEVESRVEVTKKVIIFLIFIYLF